MVFYRKYRPQTIGELDSPKLRETLTAVLSQKEVPHAFLFTGPKGLGKTSTARIIAKVLNCTHDDRHSGKVAQATASRISSKKKDSGVVSTPQNDNVSIEPDNICSQCVSITNGTNIDVLEIDGASNRGIDEIRELRERVNLAPSAAKKKVYIIDEVHMLTTEAFNALLKTIEEPPAHVVFIFATTEPQKVPATIISRCFHVSLDRATQEELVHALKRIVVGENLIVDEDALDAIAEMGDGGFRDTTKILEELVAVSSGKKITKQLFEATTGVSGISYFVSSMLESLGRRDIKKGLEIISEMKEKGLDIKFFVQEFMNFLHASMLAKLGLPQNTKYSPRGEAGQLLDTPLSTDDVRELLQLLQQAYQDTKYAVILSLPLELAIVTFCQQNVIASDPPVILNDSEGSQSTYSSNEVRSSQPSVSNNIDSTKPSLKDTRTKEQNLKVQQVLSNEPKGAKETKGIKADEGQSQVHLDKFQNSPSQLLENLIYKVKPYNNSVAGVLRGCSIASLDETAITFTTKYVFHKEKLEEQKVREILEQVMREVTGKPLKVMIELKK